MKEIFAGVFHSIISLGDSRNHLHHLFHYVLFHSDELFMLCVICLQDITEEEIESELGIVR